MTVPAIRNYENRPIRGGWGPYEYLLQGQRFIITGHWRQMVRQIADIQSRNGVYYGEDEIFAMLNPFWCDKDPPRCMTPSERTQTMKTVGCRTCGGGRVR